VANTTRQYKCFMAAITATSPRLQTVAKSLRAPLMASPWTTACVVMAVGKPRVAMAADTRLRFRDEFGDFLRFVRRPRVSPRLPGRPAGNGWWLDWFPPIRLGRLVHWALLLWAINLLFLGPIAVAAAGAGGAQHRLDLNNIPFLHALVWAPIVEELIFRYGLRNVGKALWTLPLTVAALLTGP